MNCTLVGLADVTSENVGEVEGLLVVLVAAELVDDEVLCATLTEAGLVYGAVLGLTVGVVVLSETLTEAGLVGAAVEDGASVVSEVTAPVRSRALCSPRGMYPTYVT